MKVYSKFLRNSTAVAIIAVASFPAFAMDNIAEIENSRMTKGHISSSSYKPVRFSLNPSIGAVAIKG